MAVTQHATGTQTCVIGTDHTLDTVAGGVSVLYLDLENLNVGDTLQIWAMTLAKTGGTMRRAYPIETVGGDQTGDHFTSIPVGTTLNVEWHIKQTAGTGRAFDWSVQLVG